MPAKKDDFKEDTGLIDELNHKYAEGLEKAGEERGQRIKVLFFRIVALTLALVFIFTLTGRWLSVFSGPALTFLRESHALSADPLVTELRKAVVQIHVEKGAGSTGGRVRGTGFNIDEQGLIITNRHLVEEAAVVRISFPGQGSFIASEWHVAQTADLALVKVDGRDLPHLTLAADNVNVGDQLLVIGNPLQFARIANKAVLVAKQQYAGRDYPFYIIQSHIYPGSSGSPLFNEAGEVVGVVFALRRGDDLAESYGLAISVEELKQFLGEYYEED